MTSPYKKPVIFSSKSLATLKLHIIKNIEFISMIPLPESSLIEIRQEQ